MEFLNEEACSKACQERILQKIRDKEKRERELLAQKQRREARKKEKEAREAEEQHGGERGRAARQAVVRQEQAPAALGAPGKQAERAAKYLGENLRVMSHYHCVHIRNINYHYQPIT